jgi:hypothetical protein
LGVGLSNYTISYVDGTLTVTGGPRPWVPQPVLGDVWLPFDEGESLFCTVEDETARLAANYGNKEMQACGP